MAADFFRRGQTRYDQIVHGHITLFEKQTHTSKLCNSIFPRQKKTTNTWCGVTEQKESHHLCTAKTFSKPSSLLGSFQQAVAYTAGMSQSLLCCVGAKGIAMVTGTTFSFRTRSRQIQHLPKWFLFLSKIHKMSSHYSFTHKEGCEDVSMRDKGCWFFTGLEGV